MGSEGRRTAGGPQVEPVCPACGTSVGTTMQRHKVLGAWVPVWVRKPCHNPDCKLFGHRPEGYLEEVREDAGQEAGQESGEGSGDDTREETDIPSPPGTTDKTGRSQATG
ncbi:hypothetical protein [Streptomyces solicathayae]|uniref:Zinc finger Ogr/Delta-type domain-containing protein n=1 Tax=Streptomyces solicathayae TaxID=3081768 RepID=A0ABZ0LRN8_9ACTN|nr:hypothetical protein [Streptomyces sp. HUAS YS2]WOX22126.1 hypothetical protein R2D22_12280 [Streptomyces sp. HUAS YS2]